MDTFCFADEYFSAPRQYLTSGNLSNVLELVLQTPFFITLKNDYPTNPITRDYGANVKGSVARVRRDPMLKAYCEALYECLLDQDARQELGQRIRNNCNIEGARIVLTVVFYASQLASRSFIASVCKKYGDYTGSSPSHYGDVVIPMLMEQINSEWGLPLEIM